MISGSIMSFVTEKGVQSHISHHCIKIIASINKPFEFQCNNQIEKNIFCLIVNRKVEHFLDAHDATLVVNFVDLESNFGRHLLKHLGNSDYLVLSNRQDDVENRIIPDDYLEKSQEELGELVNNYLQKMFHYYHKVDEEMDKRILDVVRFLNDNLGEELTLEVLAKQLYLSTSRARRLFQDEIGMPFSQFLLWKRMKKVIYTQYDKSMSLSTACNLYNFTDPSHFHKIFVRTFGVPPFAFISSTKIIQ